jgi:hypothetical protein
MGNGTFTPGLGLLSADWVSADLTDLDADGTKQLVHR